MNPKPEPEIEPESEIKTDPVLENQNEPHEMVRLTVNTDIWIRGENEIDDWTELSDQTESELDAESEDETATESESWNENANRTE